jgi:ketosteroid isomerase-like protein/GNAT superfamily N-acetyltransferase
MDAGDTAPVSDPTPATEVLRRAADAFNRRDTEALVAECDPEVEWATALGQMEGTVYRGHDGMRQWLADTERNWQEMQAEVEALYDTGERAVAVFQVTSRGMVSGASAEQRVVQVWQLRDGKLFRGRSRTDVARALAEVGLTSVDTTTPGPGPRPVVRTAGPGDAQGVLELWRAAGLRPSPTDDEPSLAQLRGHDPDALLVAELDGQLVGAVIAAWDGWRGSIYRLATRPGHRRRGVGATLVAAAERRLRDLGARRIGVLAVNVGPEARPFWLALGYAADPRVERFVKEL